MKSFHNKMRDKYKKTSNKSIVVYFILRILVIVCMVLQIIMGNIWNAILCIVALVLFTFPTIISEKFKIGIPSLLEAIIYLFIYSSAILGEIYNFYGNIVGWDTMLHTLNGFLCAAIGFSLIDILNLHSEKINLSPFYVALVAFCFSMTIGILWEFYEFTADSFLKTDMQKDRIVTEVSSVEINEKNENIPVKIDDIESTTIKQKNGNEVTINNGYLDIGLIDTMKDLFVNFIGATCFSIIGYLYIKNRDKFKFAENFIPIRQENF